MIEETKIYFSKYKPEKKIGEGSFGKIYSAVNINTNEQYALKMETREGGQNLLESEAYVLCYLKGSGIPIVKSYGFSGDHNILVMELLGKSLEDLFQDTGCKFSLKTVCMIADQMVIYYYIILMISLREFSIFMINISFIETSSQIISLWE